MKPALRALASAWLANALALGFGCVAALLLCEVISRWILPVGVGVERVTSRGDLLRSWLPSDRTYRQVSTEFDVETTITAAGHRAPGVEGSPEVIFLGDSFTFGWGIGDDETFAALYCAEVGQRCANLGAPGTGTVDQVARLARYLEEKSWRPLEVKLFVFAMTASFSAGNDLFDNFQTVRRSSAEDSSIAEGVAERDPGPNLLERLMSQRRLLLSHSNLVRLAKFYWGPALRSTFVPELDRTRLDESLQITRRAFAKLERLSQDYAFHYSIYLIHPVQDIIRATHSDTHRQLQAIAPVPIHTTAQLFASDPKRYYYAFDGHINAAGSRRIADLLIEATQPI